MRSFKLLLATASLALAGCATTYTVPEEYTGPTADLADSVMRESPGVLRAYAASKIDGKIVNNAIGASAQRSQVMGSIAFGLLEASYALHPKIDVLVRMVDHDGVDWSEISDETLKQGKTDALRHVARCAAIGDPDWTVDVQGWFEPTLPVEIRHFDAADEMSAWQWLGATPTGE